MDYSVTFNDVDYDLPKFNFGIDNKLKNIFKISEFKSKCKKMYDLACELIGKDKIKAILGNFETCDPNELEILFSEINRAYREPLVIKNVENVTEQLNVGGLNEISDLLTKMEKLSKRG